MVLYIQPVLLGRGEDGVNDWRITLHRSFITRCTVSYFMVCCPLITRYTIYYLMLNCSFIIRCIVLYLIMLYCLFFTRCTLLSHYVASHIFYQMYYLLTINQLYNFIYKIVHQCPSRVASFVPKWCHSYQDGRQSEFQTDHSASDYLWRKAVNFAVSVRWQIW